MKTETIVNRDGFTILEVLIAMAIFAIGILGVASMQIQSTSGNANARKYLEASEEAQGLIEDLMANDPFTSITVGTYSTVTTSGYTVNWTIANSGDSAINMFIYTVTVDDPGGNERSQIIFARTAVD